MDQPKGGIVVRHTTMPARLQKTPYGDITLTSRWKRDRYSLLASGSEKAVRWLFPKYSGDFQKTSTSTYRHEFPPAARPITVMRELQHLCAQWQEVWEDRLQDFQPDVNQPLAANNEPIDLTLTQLIERFNTARAGELAPATMERNRHYMARWVKELGADALLRELTEERIVAARSQMAKELKVSTVNCVFATLRTVFGWATSRGFMTDQCYRGLRPFREVRNARDKAWWTTAEVDIALRCAAEVDVDLHRDPKKDIPGTAILLVALGCLLGLRYEEIVMLRWADVDLDALDPATGKPNPVAHIVPKEGWMPKDGGSRAIPIHDHLADILRAYRRNEGYVLRAHTQFKGERVGTKRVYRYDPKKIWLRVLEKTTAAGLKPITPHGMRHTFASNLLMEGVSDVLVSRWLGHADTSMVHQTYGHLRSWHGDINRMTFNGTPLNKGLPQGSE